jgi:hypothetical protein
MPVPKYKIEWLKVYRILMGCSLRNAILAWNERYPEDTMKVPEPPARDPFAPSTLVMEFKEVCENIKENAPTTGNCSYARAYIRAALAMIDNPLESEGPPEETMEALHTQGLYIISNLQSWRGPIAREAKLALQGIIDRIEVHSL